LYTESDLWEISIKMYRLEKGPGVSKRVGFLSQYDRLTRGIF